MHDHDIDALARLAVELATEAGDIIRKGREKGFGSIHAKSTPTDIVTEIDKQSESHIVSALRERRPDDAILGEEGAAFDGTTGVRWVIDPLDGTVNFTYGIPNYAVSIGVEVDGIPTIGVVYNPATDELYRAARGTGAFCNDDAIEVRDEVALSHALVATGFGYASERRAMQARTLQDVLPLVRDIRRGGSAALDICSVAAGRIDAYYEFGVWPWDVAAGEVILIEAGGVISDFTRNRASRSVVATSCDTLHEALCQLLAD